MESASTSLRVQGINELPISKIAGDPIGLSFQYTELYKLLNLLHLVL